MHLLVLSAFRPKGDYSNAIAGSLNAPFGAQCFPTLPPTKEATLVSRVSMHLLVLSAFRHPKPWAWEALKAGLNAPFGAQCFPTCAFKLFWLYFAFGLNAPFGAQCFPTLDCIHKKIRVLRLNAPFGAQCFPTHHRKTIMEVKNRLNAPFGAQCFPTKNKTPYIAYNHSSQCTFWCSVLSDRGSRVTYEAGKVVSMHLLVLSAFRHK